MSSNTTQIPAVPLGSQPARIVQPLGPSGRHVIPKPEVKRLRISHILATLQIDDKTLKRIGKGIGERWDQMPGTTKALAITFQELAWSTFQAELAKKPLVSFPDMGLCKGLWPVHYILMIKLGNSSHNQRKKKRAETGEEVITDRQAKKLANNKRKRGDGHIVEHLDKENIAVQEDSNAQPIEATTQVPRPKPVRKGGAKKDTAAPIAAPSTAIAGEAATEQDGSTLAADAGPLKERNVPGGHQENNKSEELANKHQKTQPAVIVAQGGSKQKPAILRPKTHSSTAKAAAQVKVAQVREPPKPQAKSVAREDPDANKGPDSEARFAAGEGIAGTSKAGRVRKAKAAQYEQFGFQAM